MEVEKDDDFEGIGKIGDNYIILQKLSFGGQANVFSVKDIKTNKIYAAKIPKYNDSFLDKEINILYYLKDRGTPNIINIKDSGKGIIIINGKEPENKKYLILELATKRCLSEYIKVPDKEFTRGFGELYSRVIFYKIVKIIQMIHGQKISHRDIKLDNILLDGEDFEPKISDFGLATEYRKQLYGNLGTKQYKAPEIGGIYDGYKIDVFSLGVTLLCLTYYGPAFEDEPRKSLLYKLLMKREEEFDYWDTFKSLINEKIEEATEEFKDLFYNMVHNDPKKRYTIEQILNHEWFGEIPYMTPEQLKLYEQQIKIKEEFKRREVIVMKNFKEIMIQKNNESICNPTKGASSSDSNKDIFNGELDIKNIEANKYMNYCIHIKGILEANKFLKFLVHKIKKKFPYCLIKTDEDNKPNFNVNFNGEGIYDNIKEQLKKLGIKNEEKENEEEDNEEEENELILRIKLYKTSEGYLLRFVKQQGDKYDFCNKYEIIKNFVQEFFV